MKKIFSFGKPGRFEADAEKSRGGRKAPWDEAVQRMRRFYVQHPPAKREALTSP